MTIPMAVIGLAISLFPHTDVSFKTALLTGLGILVLMLLLAWLFEIVRHKEGLGGGDIKLLAAMATFLGVINLAFIIFFSSIIAVVVALTSPKTREQGIPYGPFLVAATFVWIMFGHRFLGWYLNLF